MKKIIYLAIIAILFVGMQTQLFLFMGGSDYTIMHALLASIIVTVVSVMIVSMCSLGDAVAGFVAYAIFLALIGTSAIKFAYTNTVVTVIYLAVNHVILPLLAFYVIIKNNRPPQKKWVYDKTEGEDWRVLAGISHSNIPKKSKKKKEKNYPIAIIEKYVDQIPSGEHLYEVKFLGSNKLSKAVSKYNAQYQGKHVTLKKLEHFKYPWLILH